MRFVTRLVPITVTLALLVLGSGLAHAATQEAFICTLKEGKTVEDMMKVASEFKASIKGLKSSKDYTAQVLTPIASQNLDTVIWIGHAPSFASLAAFSDEYTDSDVATKMGPMFEEVADCESRSIWRVREIK